VPFAHLAKTAAGSRGLSAKPTGDGLAERPVATRSLSLLPRTKPLTKVIVLGTHQSRQRAYACLTVDGVNRREFTLSLH
jgi:hypothetical protein